MTVRVSFLLSFLMLALSGCGFTPLYGQGTGPDVNSSLDEVEIAMIPDQEGVFLRNELIDRFYRGGYPSSPAYILTLSPIEELERNLDVTVNSESTRRQVRLSTQMRLVDKASGASVMDRQLSAITSYNVLGSQFTTRVSEADAREAALNDLARQIERQTTLYFNNQ